jgi:GT2 family glycosyltransferase
MPFVSIVVCSLNRKSSLKECLINLSKIDYSKTRYEIIVVDGGSTDGTDYLMKKHFPDARFVLDTRIGISHARNTGAKNAKGLFVAYTDDDCVVSKDWLRNLIAGFSSEKIGAVGGPVRLLHPESIHQKLLAKAALGLYDIGEGTCEVKTLITSNMAVRREVFQKIEFDTKLGRRGSALYDLEDIGFCESLLEHGYKLLYTSDALVFHNIDIRKANMRYILTRALRGGISLYFMRKKRAKSRKEIFAGLLQRIPGNLLLFVEKPGIENLYLVARNVTACLTSLNETWLS